MSADESSRDDDRLEPLRKSGLFGPRGASVEEELACPSVGALRDALSQIDAAIDLGVAGDDLEYYVREVCGRCFPHRSAVFFLDDAPCAPGISRAAAAHHGVSDAMFEESGIERVESYEPRYAASGSGFDVPILSEGKLLGVLALEYPEGAAEPSGDRDALALIAGAIGGSIARARATDESRRLREQIKQMQKLASIGQLAASITHEMNHPLTTISVYAELLLRRAESAGRDEWETVRLSRIVAAAERMHSYTRDLVSYSRPSPKERAHEDVRKLVERAISICEPLVAQSGAKLTLHVAEDVGAIFCVGSQIEQVLVNLVVNASHAVTPGEGAIRVAAERTPAWLELVVEDDGPGIPVEQRDVVFQAFFSTKAPGTGTGLGLSIVQRIVEEHGGSISIGDGPLGGASFRILLPTSRR